MLVQPIRDKEVIGRIMKALEDDQTDAGRRRYLMFATGIFLGRRICDMLRLRVGDVRGKTSIVINEKKTGKNVELFIPKKLRDIYRERLAGMDDGDWLLQSPTKDRITGRNKPVARETAWRDMKAIQSIARLDNVNIGTHTMRKTFGYHYYQKTRNIAMLMKLFNHSKEEITQRYIGLSTDETRKAFMDVNDMYDI